MAEKQKTRRSRWRRFGWGLLYFIGVLLLVAIVAAGIRFVFLQGRATPTYQTPAQLADADGAFVEVNGMTIYYRETGPVDGPAVILVHGFLLESAPFDPLLTQLAAQGYHVITFDRPPFGLSDKDPTLDYTRQAHGDLIVGLMDTLGIGQATLVGHSAGGVVAASAALRYPTRVTKLVLVAGAFLEYLNATSTTEAARPANPAGGPMMNLIANGFNPVRPWAELELRAYFTPQRVQNFGRATYAQPEAVPSERVERLSRFLQIEGWERGLRAFGQQLLTESPLQVADLAALTMPTLLLWGEEDIFIPPVTGQRLAEAIPGAQLITYPGCGHIAWEGCDSTFVADLVAFLQD